MAGVGPDTETQGIQDDKVFHSDVLDYSTLRIRVEKHLIRFWFGPGPCVKVSGPTPAMESPDSDS